MIPDYSVMASPVRIAMTLHRPHLIGHTKGAQHVGQTGPTATPFPPTSCYAVAPKEDPDRIPDTPCFKPDNQSIRAEGDPMPLCFKDSTHLIPPKKTKYGN